MTDDLSLPADHPLELLAFEVSGQEYAINIMMVREIRGWSNATPLPHAPSYVRGVINLRGTVLPIVDFSARLGMESAAATARNVVIVVQLEHQMIGVLVDAVSDIITISESDIQPPPDMGAPIAQSFVKGLTILGDRVIRVIEPNGALGTLEASAA